MVISGSIHVASNGIIYRGYILHVQESTHPPGHLSRFGGEGCAGLFQSCKAALRSSHPLSTPEATTVNWRHDLGVPVGSHLMQARSGSPRGDGGQQRGGRQVRVSVPQTCPCPGAHLQVAVFLYRGDGSLGDCVSSRSFSWLGDSALCTRAPQVLRRSVQLSPIRVSRRSIHPWRTTLWV